LSAFQCEKSKIYFSLLQSGYVTFNTRQDFGEIRYTTEQAACILDWLLGGTSHFYDAFCDFCKEEHPEMYDLLYVSDYSATGSETVVSVEGKILFLFPLGVVGVDRLDFEPKL